MAIETIVNPLLTDPESRTARRELDTDLGALTPDELAAAPAAAEIVARLIRADERDGSKPVRVAAFNSFI